MRLVSIVVCQSAIDMSAAFRSSPTRRCSPARRVRRTDPRLIHRPFHARRIPDVGGDRERRIPQPLLRPFEIAAIASGDHDRSALVDEGPRNRVADAADPPVTSATFFSSGRAVGEPVFISVE